MLAVACGTSVLLLCLPLPFLSPLCCCCSQRRQTVTHISFYVCSQCRINRLQSHLQCKIHATCPCASFISAIYQLLVASCQQVKTAAVTVVFRKYFMQLLLPENAFPICLMPNSSLSRTVCQSGSVHCLTVVSRAAYLAVCLAL